MGKDKQKDATVKVEPEESGDEAVVVEKPSKAAPKKRKHKDITVKVEPEESEDEPSMAAPSPKKKRKQKDVTVKVESEESEDEPSMAAPSPKKAKGKHKLKDVTVKVGPERSGDEAVVVEKASKAAPSPSKAKAEVKVVDERPYEELITLVSAIAKPLASKKLTKKLYKVVKKSQKAKRLKRGVREVVKGLRKGEKGLVVFAGDVSPIDVISHMPVFCEDKGIPYCYVPTRKDLGAAAFTRRPTSVVMVQSAEEYKTLYEDCYSLVDALPLPI